MIADRTSSIAVQGNLTGDRVAMSIDDAAMEHIMGILTDLYSDPRAAVLREYSTNGYDAHVEAGVKRPIEVSLPSPLAPFLRIRDFGIGLSVEDIHDIYSKYGASTKRGTNDQVGMLGLGCKSALTYTDQFTLSSVKDGIRSQVAVSRDENGSGSMTIVSVEPTTDERGTEVIIPAKRGDSFESEAADFFRFWADGTVLVNGKPPKPVEGLHVTDRLIVTENDRYTREDFVVMGNVAYPVPQGEISHGLPYGHGLVAYVDIGSVNFTPSREALHMTAKTKATLAAIATDFKAHTAAAIQKEVDRAPTASDAVVVANQWHDVLKSRHGSVFAYTYKGKPVPQTFTTSNPDVGITVVPRRSHVLNRHTCYREVPAAYVRNALWAYGYDKPKFTSAMKKKINKWMEDNNIDGAVESLILTEDKPDSTWVDKAQVVKWADIAATKLPRAAVTRSGRIPGSYDLYDTAGSYRKGIPGDDIDTKLPVFWIDSQNWSRDDCARVLHAVHGPCTVVILPHTRVAKFCRNLPGAQEAEAAVKVAFEAWRKAITKQQLRALAMHEHGHVDIFAKLDPAKLDDPELVESAKLARTDLTKIMTMRKLYRKAMYGEKIAGSGWSNPLEKYPLFDSYKFNRYQQHTYQYLNAVYAANQKEG